MYYTFKIVSYPSLSFRSIATHIDFLVSYTVINKPALKIPDIILPVESRCRSKHVVLIDDILSSDSDYIII